VLMDVMMPGMDGIAVTRRLRALPGAMGRVPVVAVTASAFPEDVAACHAAGMVGHLSKPVERAQLLQVLAGLVAGRPAEDAAPDDLGVLRPLFLAELRKRLGQLEAAGAETTAWVEAVHAITGTVGHLGEPERVAVARAALRALRDGHPDAPERVRTLQAELRRTFPDFPVEAAA